MTSIKYLLFEQDFLWLEQHQGQWRLPCHRSLAEQTLSHQLCLFSLANDQFVYAEIQHPLDHHPFKRVHLKDCIELLGVDTFQLLGKGKQLLEWQRNHRFCGHCGTSTISADQDRARQCPACQLTAYPRIAPCVLAAVYRPGQILLARSKHFQPGLYSILAGFIEAGETAEHCCQREVFEEVGVHIGPPQYFGSQPWPFPHQLMLAYCAEYQSGTIRIDEQEIEDARWFDFDQLPLLPMKHSLSFQLIEHLRTQRR